jgi:L-alanine-DL-glutamate epimerase-like enolase superfamily enzyme
MIPMTRKQFVRTVGLGAVAAWSARPGWGAPVAAEARAAAKPMKIKDVEIYYNDIALVEPFVVALGTVTNANGVLIRVLTDAGLVGIGEASPVQVVTGETQDTNIDAARRIRQSLLGGDPLAIERTGALAGAFVHSNPSMVAAFDMALYDILGKTAGLPVFRLLGGDKTSFETDKTLGISTAEKMALGAKDAIAGGYRVVKLKIGERPDADADRVRAVREAVGPGPAIRLDANQGYTVPQAISALRQMEAFGIEFCEQPVVSSDIDGLRQIRNESPIAIAADEALFGPADAVRLVKAEACDYFNIKLMKAGGITNALKIATVAEAANIRCMLGCMMETRVGLTAAAHVHGARKNIIYADLDSYLFHKLDPVVGGITVKNGIVTIPEAPGLGADFDPAFLKTLRKA